MNPRHPRVIAAGLVAVLVATLGTGEARGDSTGSFVGLDGLTHSWSPQVVDGADGYLFMGPDFDTACAYGDRFRHYLQRLAKLATVIERTGRTVVFTIAPNKSSALPDLVDAGSLPQGECSSVGLDLERKALDGLSDPRYLPLRRKLASSTRQVYWRTDLHWSTVGGSVFARALARHLSPRLGRAQRYAYTTETGVGNLTALLGDHTTTETLPRADPAGGVRVATAPGAPDWSGYPSLTYDHSWRSAPGRKTWPGRTLVLGDSFAMFALQNLRPLFRHGRFMWFAHTDPADQVAAIADADTVVIEIVQVFTVDSELTRPSFRRAVASALGRG